MPLIVGITGADGLIGWHARAYLRAFRPDVEVRLATRTTFADEGALAAFVSGADAVIHCAGMNRGEEQDVEATNISLAHQLVRACDLAADSHGVFPDVVFTNSVQINRDSGYGRGKQTAAHILAGAAKKRRARFVNLILPHVFGEFGRPFHNSVVSTFCHQIACGEVSAIHVDGSLELVHAKEVAARCVEAIDGNDDGDYRVAGIPLYVSTLLKRLNAMADAYIGSNIVPSLSDPLDLSLFNTLRSYRFPRFAQVTLPLRRDARGALFEAVKAINGGQTFFSTTFTGVTRGNHFHTYKFERFLVCSGEAEIRLRRLFSDAVYVFRVSGEVPCCVDIPTFHTHSITNVGAGELATLYWASEIFDPEQPDTYAEMVAP